MTYFIIELKKEISLKDSLEMNKVGTKNEKVLYNLLQTVLLKPIETTAAKIPGLRKSEVNCNSCDNFHNSTSLRSMRERRKNGAKNSRGPAFIFGKNGSHQPNNDIGRVSGVTIIENVALE